MTMNGRANDETARAAIPTVTPNVTNVCGPQTAIVKVDVKRGRSYEESLMLAVYVILSALFSIGVLVGVALVYTAQWIWP